MAREATEIIRVTEETWSDLNARKQPGDSFDDVIRRVLEAAEDESGNPTRVARAD